MIEHRDDPEDYRLADKERVRKAMADIAAETVPTSLLGWPQSVQIARFHLDLALQAFAQACMTASEPPTVDRASLIASVEDLRPMPFAVHAGMGNWISLAAVLAILRSQT